MSHLPLLGPDATLLDVYRRYPVVARHLLGLLEAAVTLTPELSRGECELVGASISALNGCGYCRGIHARAARACGVEQGALAAALAAGEGDARLGPALAYARCLTATPAEVGTEEVAALRAAGFSDDSVAQLAVLTAAFNALNRLADGLGLEAGEAFHLAAGERIAAVGYAGTARLLGVGEG